MVAGGDDHRHGALGDGGGEGLLRLREGHAAVEYVPRQQHQLRAALRAQAGDGAQQLALLAPADGGLFLRQALEGAVQVEVRRVQYPYHVYLTASARRQAPVSVSSSKSAPSSLPGPGAQS